MSELYSSENAPPLFDEILDRKQLDLPDWYLRSAEGAVIAGDHMLTAAGYRKGSYRPRGWRQIDRFSFTRVSNDGKRRLCVRLCGRYWTIERTEPRDGPLMNDYALVCAFSRRLVWARTRQAAMRLADYCDPNPLPPVAASWVDVDGYRSH